MSLATAVGQVIFSQKSGVYMPAIMCNKGDLYQEYNGDSSNPVDISPDFTTLQPILSFVLTSSRVAEGLVVPSSMKWYFNDTELTFGSNKISTNSFSGETGHFEFINYQAGVQNYYALRIKKNLVKAAGAAPCTIKGEATVAVGNTSDKIQYVYTIPITYGVGNSKRVTIMSGDNKYFTLTTQGDSCKLKAVARVGSDEITSGLTYKWYKLSNGAWSVISGQTGQTLTVTTDMVDTSGQFKAEVYQSGVMIGMDVQTVMDVSDPLDIILNPVPEDETIRNEEDTVVYTPTLVKRGSTTKYKDMRFYFTFMDSAGVVLNPSTANTAAASGTCTYKMCDQAGGNVSVVITTEE